MPEDRTARRLERRADQMKARARAKQQWLERMLSTPARTPQASQRRQNWITYALERVKHAQGDLKERASVIDAYTEHLHVLEMTLMGAAEDTGKAAASGSKESKS